MSSLSSFANPAAYHILSYGALLGSTLFQSFIGGIIAFRVLPRPQFAVLQKNTFPAYFALQTITSLIMLLTYPAGPTALLPLSSTPKVHTLHSVLIGIMLVCGVLNWTWVGPQTTEVMRLRKHQETRDGKKSYDKGPHSDEMKALNRRFGILHGVSSLANLVGFLGMCWYGVLLAERVR
ncbi:hypothetical protein EJ04DRAFT_502784 [Polyplosphaeria fusca]|uniref:TMEM205-like domain-containing protein n=1 Tax=Polyplosphaeria fusca TaxID=682080 RepID=A0A9P4QP61_9PLEO|nr:hypothetical protein EJ04DRAFT_502784 [Polyplosphaeria fusca]